MLISKLLEKVECEPGIKACSDDITLITCDSRKVIEGALFVCIKGERSDGHDYAKKACEAGAKYVLCERDLGLENQIIVPSTRKAFAEVCSAWFSYPLESVKMIGVTGTNGKTSTTYILKHILDSCGHKSGLIGTICNMVGDESESASYTTPDTYELYELIARMRDAGCEYCVMEVSSHALEQGRVSGLHFIASAFTNLTQDHLDYHKTMDNYFAAKCMLFSVSDSAVVNLDDDWGRRISPPSGVSLLSFGIDSEDAMLRADAIEYHSGGAEFNLSFGGESRRVRFHIPGRFSAYNAMSAAGLALCAGIPFDKVCSGLESSSGVKGRAEVFPTGRDFTIILDYAHTPDGIENILSSMREVSSGRVGILMGCGGDRDPLKRPLMGEAAARLADYVIVTSDNPRTEDPNEIIRQILPGVEKHTAEYTVITDRAAAMEYAVRNAQKDDVIVFAGKGHEDYQIIGTEKRHFDEREVLRGIFETLEREGN